MPIPLLPLFLGLLGTRELIQRKGVARQNTITARRDASDVEALRALMGGGQLGIHGMGPPTAIGTGETDLTDTQISVLRAMSVGDTDAALTQGLAFADKNQQQANFDTSAALSQAGVDQQKANYLLNVDKFNFDRDQFAFGKATTAQELLDATRALVDPEFSAQRAAKAGEKNFIVRDQATGAFEQVPLRGTEPFEAAVKGIVDSTSLLGEINRLRTLSRQLGGTRDPGNQGVRELQSLHTSILLKLKDAFELGALTGPDIGLVLARFPDPTDAGNVLASSPEAIEQAFSSVSRSISDQLGLQMQAVRNFQGIDFRILNTAVQTTFGAKLQDQRALQSQEAFLSDQQFQQGAAPERGMFAGPGGASGIAFLINQAMGAGGLTAGSLGRQIVKPIVDEAENITRILAAFAGIKAMTR